MMDLLLDNRLYLGGFADQNINFDDDANRLFTWVTEHQLGIRLVHWLYVIAEYRFNQFFANRQHGVGLGLEYTVKF